MELQTVLLEGTQKLEGVGIETARLDALVLLEDVLGIDRARLLAEPEREISTNERAELAKLLNRRAKHEPLAYIRGHAEFYGRNFVVNHDVLVPRPETEVLVDLFKSLFDPVDPNDNEPLNQAKKSIQAKKSVKVADIGTGCGAIGITAYEELKSQQNISVELIDIDEKALKTAKYNVVNYSAPILLKISDLLVNTRTKYDVLLCNLPYVPNDYVVNKSAQFEPKIALFAGSDGLDLYRKLFEQANIRSHGPLLILTESLPGQHNSLRSIAEHNGYCLVQTEDFIQVFTVSKNTV